MREENSRDVALRFLRIAAATLMHALREVIGAIEEPLLPFPGRGIFPEKIRRGDHLRRVIFAAHLQREEALRRG